VNGSLQSIWRYPVKGFTPEALAEVTLTAGAYFPFDRLYAVEDGPSGFDPAAPAHVSKQKFTVLAKIAAIARIRTSFDEDTQVLAAEAKGHPPFRGALAGEPGRAAFAAWLAAVLGDEARGPLKVLPSAPAHRFTDDVEGFVSIVNLASIRALEAEAGRRVDPRRFRGNLYVEGWPAWIENSLPGRRLWIGEAELAVGKPIVRCAATHVDPQSGERDLDVVGCLHQGFGHTLCGVYAQVRRGGRLRPGDRARIEAAPGGA